MIRKTLCALCATMALSTPSMGATVGFDIFFNGTDVGDMFIDDALLVPIAAPPTNHKVAFAQTTYSITASGGTFTQATSSTSTGDFWVFDPTGTTLIGTDGEASTVGLRNLAADKFLTFFSSTPGLFRITGSTGIISQGAVAFARHPAAQVPVPASVFLLMSALLGMAAVPRFVRKNERRVAVAA